MRVSDTVLGAPSAFTMVTDRIRCQKPSQSSVSCLKTAREHSFVSELSQGTPETKIAPKWALEGARRTRNNRIDAIELQEANIEPWDGSELQILTGL